MAGATSLTAGLATLVIALCGVRGQKATCHTPTKTTNTFYDFKINDVFDEKLIDFSDFRNKVVLVVNVTTYHGHTHQYNGLNALMTDYAGQRDFLVLGLPCNQFLKQEPGANGTETMNGVKYVRPRLTPLFNLTQRIDVNGQYQHPLYRFLKSYCKSVRTEYRPSSTLFYQPKEIGDVYWNFEKFLVGADGHVKFRYSPSVQPIDIRPDIEALLGRHVPVVG
uniref:Glutathione peroxidase n=1 Tax=Haliotis diversicolor supertexta TaxID=283615 RepID=D6PW93_HALDV|nr:selenium-dependent glutathione peroxidase [Haliotis diversicolor supertexta]